MRLDDIKESAVMALDTLRANKLRSSLTILGVSVGVVTVIFMVSIIQGLNKAFADQVESLGSNTIFISKFSPSFGRPPGPEEIHRKDLGMEDAEAVRREAPSVAGVSPIHRKLAVTVRYQDKQTDTPILLGVTPYYEFVHTQYAANGRFVNDIDMQDRSNVTIIGVDVKRALFPYEDPIDKEVRINGNPYRVVGVMEPLGNFFGQSRDNSIFVPITTFDKYYAEGPFPEVVFFMVVRPISRAYVKTAIDEITDILRRRRRVPHVAVLDRSSNADWTWRDRGSVNRLVSDFSLANIPTFLCADVGSYRGLRSQCWHWPGVWPLAGVESGALGSN